MDDDDDALLPLTETMLFRKEREKTDDDVMLLLKNVCKCVTRWNETLESSRCWRVVERERGIRFGGWCAQKWYEKTREKRERFSKRYFARRERERHKRTGEEDLFVWERKESFKLVPKSGSTWKNFFHIDRFLWIFDKKIFWFSFWFELFSTLLLSKTASLKERQLLITHINNMAKRTKSARKAAKSVRPNRELLAREDETRSHLLLPFFFARF